MPGLKWTSEQLSAINYSGDTLLVSAAAGSGKSAVLVERVISRILDEKSSCHIDDFLIVTFTKAAAGELREKIRRELIKRGSGEKDGERVFREVNLLNKAKITTIHAFCMELLRERYYLLDLTPDFSVMDDAESDILMAEAIERALTSRYIKEEMDEGFISLLDMFASLRDDKRVSDAVLNLYDRAWSLPFPEDFLMTQKENFAKDPGAYFDFLYESAILPEMKFKIDSLLSSIGEMLDAAKGDDAVYEKYAPAINSDRELLKGLSLALSRGFDEAVDYLKDVKFMALSQVRKCERPLIKDAVKGRRDEVKDEILSMRKDLFYMEKGEWVLDLAAISPAVCALIDLCLDFEREFAALKREKNLIDYTDMQHLALSLLIEKEGEKIKKTPLAAELSKSFCEILIDEYQDVSEIQEMIFRALSNEDKNLFFVGDIKQSIYRFREARPQIFLKKYLDYSKDLASAGPKKVILSKNFRSRQEVIDFVNIVFHKLMSKDSGEIDYGGDERLYVGAPYGEFPPKKSEILLIEDDYKGEEGLIFEAEVIAKRIKALFASGFSVENPFTGERRPLKYSDIAILLRSQKDSAGVIRAALENAGIPASSDEGESFFSSMEITLMLALLKVIDNPTRDIPLVGLLRSFLFSFDEDELIEIKEKSGGGFLWEGVKALGEEGDAKCREFIKKLGDYKEKSRYMEVYRLLWHIYEDLGVFSLIAHMDDRREREDNLKVLFKIASAYEKSSFKGLSSFINYIAQIAEKKEDFRRPYFKDGGDFVKIMTIHKSKGLEFPVCFVSQLSRRFNLKDLDDSLVMDSSLGLGPEFKDVERKIRYDTIAKSAIKMRGRKESVSEEMRLLYVAMTRAKEKLILTARTGALDKRISALFFEASKNNEKLDPFWVRKASSFLDWVLMSAIGESGGFPLRERAGITENSGGADSPFMIKTVSPKKDEDFSDLDCVKTAQAGADLPQRGDGGENGGEIKAGFLSGEGPGSLSRGPLTAEGEAKAKETRQGVDLKEGALEKADSLSGEKAPLPLGGESGGRAGLSGETPVPPPTDAEIDEAINLLLYDYPYKKSAVSPVKLTVTELKGKIGEEAPEEPSHPPSALYEPGAKTALSAAERGTALHTVMQFITFTPDIGEGDIKKSIDALVQKGFLSKEAARSLDIKTLLSFSRSDISRRAAAAKRVFKEESFNLQIEAGLIGASEGDSALIQGVIDCFFIEADGRAVLIDYKTDRVYSESGGDLLQKYKSQIAYYKRAIKEIYGYEVKESYIYSFALDRPISADGV